ncbi:MAG: glycosyltransferase [Gammaproteobacteria bacterium]|nr:glycosyltransferase [Gammaproteobacteria bacterium]
MINSYSADYVEDQLAAGLTAVLGRQNVVFYPVNINYYLARRPYPRNMGVCRDSWNYFTDLLAVRRQLRSFQFDAVIIGSTKRDTFERFLQISDYLPAHIPIIFVDGGDWPAIGGDAQRMHFDGLYQQVMSERTPKVIFKREYLSTESYPENTFAFPMAFKPPKAFEKAPLKYDVTCWCVESHPLRTQALELLQNRFDCKANGTVKGQTFRTYKRKGNTYLSELSASKIACNFRGVGWDTLRYWEIPGVQTLMISGLPQITIPDNFKHEEHVIFCRDDLSDLLDKADYYLKHDQEREQLAAAAHDHIMKYHTHLARAHYFLERVRDHI